MFRYIKKEEKKTTKKEQTKPGDILPLFLNVSCSSCFLVSEMIQLSKKGRNTRNVRSWMKL